MSPEKSLHKVFGRAGKKDAPGQNQGESGQKRQYVGRCPCGHVGEETVARGRGGVFSRAKNGRLSAGSAGGLPESLSGSKSRSGVSNAESSPLEAKKASVVFW
ncbi:hypothetical protein BOX24_04915 [Leptospirillum ferriphilum]|uniref:Uncharacterized protein n=2 Tax=Leptospirillum ferriphilum TaxID=178606 RepID=A0A059Y1U9_9BACT|nr:hypothetical protein Y981_02045 [Leptospirillum ferriphilum YSK]OOH72735.1 hypothetical protein BOX24_04915 [Leptospirillum ferriphilum]